MAIIGPDKMYLKASRDGYISLELVSKLPVGYLFKIFCLSGAVIEYMIVEFAGRKMLAGIQSPEIRNIGDSFTLDWGQD